MSGETEVRFFRVDVPEGDRSGRRAWCRPSRGTRCGTCRGPGPDTPSQRRHRHESTLASAGRTHTASLRLPIEGALPSFGGAAGWLNSEPLTAAGLGGRVILADFWTYTCINWRRSLPYVRAWARKYAGQGLVVIGVHTPEFPFEKDADNIRRAVKDMRVGYPVAIDNDYAIWRAFGNHYWAALYFADAQGVGDPCN